MNIPAYEDESFDAKGPDDCNHVGCHCRATAEGFCCQKCKASDNCGELELSCDCGHSDCMGDFFAERPVRTANV
jgi:hypothetical protein